mmetsp:Transcript_17287/g.25184  ORF Transcript_17287/g.25184 Transcript_17287/m.25184 type:complete len:273 (+) Transcript_17287:1957-2775(+)
MLGESVLCKEIFTNELGHLHDNLLILRKRFLSNKLYNLGEVVLLLEDGTGLVSEVGVTGIHLVEERLEYLHVLRVRDEPVDRREMLTLGELLVKTPEHLHNGKSGGSHGIREISTGRRYGSHNGDSSLTVRRSKTGYTSSTLVESSKTSSEVGGVTGIGRHLSKTSRNLTKSLCPTRGRISHHGNIHALITEVLGKGDTGVNGSLTGSYRHVGGVGHQSGALHDSHLALLLGDRIGKSHGKLGEITKYLRHLVTALTASDINNGIRVGELRE